MKSLIPTIEDDEENEKVQLNGLQIVDEEEEEEESATEDIPTKSSSLKHKQQQKQNKQKKDQQNEEIRSDFLFADDNCGNFGSKFLRNESGNVSVWNFEYVKSMMTRGDQLARNRLTVDDLIQKRLRNKTQADLKQKDLDLEQQDLEKDEQDVELSEGEDEEGEEEREMDIEGNDETESESEDKLREKKRKSDYFDDDHVIDATPDLKQQPKQQQFSDLKLSRPLQRALTDLGFQHPTNIQIMAIPVALSGKDICGAASTGSGKTAAFLLPILERLLYRPKGQAYTRVLILTPTRELAAQCHSVGTQLARYTDITFALCVGGLSGRDQEAQLKRNPDVVIATPGRLIDHLQNSQSFGLDRVEILCMDEADRMLEEGFEDELTEIVRQCPRKRQTLLFSATMTDNVDQLVRLSLQRPVRLFLDPTKAVTENLVQEFIRVRSSPSVPGATGNSKDSVDQELMLKREAILLALCHRTYKKRSIIFCASKAQCHRLKIIFGLHKLAAVELHGSLTQLQRLEALEHFRDGKAEFLLATDLAARGLDISGVQTVINFQMPAQYDRYVHRVGRTARHLASGRAVSLVAEKERKMLKAILSNLKPGQVVKQRVLPAKIIQRFRDRLAGEQDIIEAVLGDEVEEKAMQQAEMTLKKAENMIEHADEIYNRPAKQWFQTEKERQDAKKKLKEQQQMADEGETDAEGGPANISSLKSLYKEELAKEMSKLKKKTVAGGGLSRKEKRRKQLMASLPDDDLAKASVKQKLVAKSMKKAARDGTAPIVTKKSKSKPRKSKSSGKPSMNKNQKSKRK